MRKLLTIILAILTGFNAANAQAAKSVYFELGGPGLASFNYDTRFGPREDGLGGRIGFGGFSLTATTSSSRENVTVIFIPVGLSYILGKDGKNYFELGGGVSPVIASSTFDDENFSSTFGHVTFGYRLQPASGGFTFRAFISPIFGGFGFIPYYGGVSFGYKFGGGKGGEK